MRHAEHFEQHRSLLFTIAYEILGTAADAEDAVQDSYPSWASVSLSEVRDPRAFLVRIVTRRALDVLRTQQRRRESYVGPWLPEPIATDVDADAELVEYVSMAMLLVLETLSPVERAVFVLREVFDFPYDDIANVVGKSTAAVRQIAHRAREHVQARRQRFTTDTQRATEVTGAFLLAAHQGDIAALVDMLAPDVVAISDGGGVVSAARRPVHGADRVARFLAGLTNKANRAPAEVTMDFASCNGLPALLVREDGRLSLVLLVEVSEGVIQTLYLLRNPEKLYRFGQTPQIAR
ncbi:RNA polymerase sigma-70 factor [Hoyosella altamirensis]|uniref:RNA polymerase sigma-70 factor n=1 Tax=Hoyosella altamirensis TaxID=616997 RepID=UPI0007DAF3E0|nr:RNA polymerase sigma-70 factor [Hoyosella altamirensis]